MKIKLLKNMEIGVFICCVILLVIGSIALYSSTQETDYQELKRQLIWVTISIPIMICIIFIDYELIVKVSPAFYGLFILLLIAVLFTPVINGATSWFTITEGVKIQPSEFAKIFVILFLAYVMTKVQEKGLDEINRPTRLLLLLAIVGVPVLLIIKQPDYGTAIAFMLAMILMLFVGGINKKYIIASIAVVAITIPILYNFILPEHARNRIDVFLNPNLDPRGTGYNVIQSKLAIGSGQLFGMGLLKGNQTQLGFLHPKTTDFIFSVIGEEMGFIVAGAVIIVYVVLINKAIYIAKTAKDELGSYIATGIVGIFIFHMVENIGMTIGLLPITGVPLPFVSYGGSSLVTNFICIGLLLNISARRQKTIFVD